MICVTLADVAMQAAQVLSPPNMNELQGHVLKVNLARPMKGALQLNGNRASKCLHFFFSYLFDANVSVLFLSLGLRGMVKRACKTSGTIWQSVYFRFSL